MTGSPLSLTRRVLVACLAITSVMLLVFSGLAAWGWSQYSTAGIAAAGVASATCWLSGLIAFGAMILFRDPQHAIAGVFLGMLCRLGVPLLVGIGLVQSRSGLLDASVCGMMVVAYLTGLLIETAMAWWILGQWSGGSLPGVAKAS